MRHALIALCLVFLAGCASFCATSPAPQQLTGIYTGEVNSGGTNTPIVTELFVGPDGHLSGKYTMQESTGPAEGQLYDIRREGPYTLLAAWKDKYGTGALRMLFSANGASFRGFWGNSKHATLLRWDGQK